MATKFLFLCHSSQLFPNTCFVITASDIDTDTNDADTDTEDVDSGTEDARDTHGSGNKCELWNKN